MGEVLSIGIHKISNELYHQDPCPMPSLSRSTIRELLFQSPAHAWWNHPRLNPDYKFDEDEKFDIGKAAHSILLEGLDICEVIDAEDWRTKVAKEGRELARKEGKTPLLIKQYEKTLTMVDAARQQISECTGLGIINHYTEGDAELSYIWKKDETFFRARLDWISKDRMLILDYKTTGLSANPAEFARQIVSIGLDIQAAFYPMGVKAIEGIEPKLIFVVQETSEPYLCSFIGLPPEFLEMGKIKVDYGIFLWNQCMESGKWPGYPQQICWVTPPAWTLAQWEQIAERIGM